MGSLFDLWSDAEMHRRSDRIAEHILLNMPSKDADPVTVFIGALKVSAACAVKAGVTDALFARTSGSVIEIVRQMYNALHEKKS